MLRGASLVSRNLLRSSSQSLVTPLSVVGLPASASVLEAAMTQVRWATSKAGGSTKNGRDSNPKFLGVKKFGGEAVQPGNIILRQRGRRYDIVESTRTVGLGKDYTVFALVPGYVKFWWHKTHKKYYVEVVRSPPEVQPTVKFPIVQVKSYELPALMRMVDGGEKVEMSEQVATALAAHRLAVQKAQSSGGADGAQRRADVRAALLKAAAAPPAAAASAST